MIRLIAVTLLFSACSYDRIRNIELSNMRSQCADEAERYSMRALMMRDPVATCAVVVVDFSDECRCAIHPAGSPTPLQSLRCLPGYGCTTP